jgi:hypothetical protein
MAMPVSTKENNLQAWLMTGYTYVCEVGLCSLGFASGRIDDVEIIVANEAAGGGGFGGISRR